MVEFSLKILSDLFISRENVTSAFALGNRVFAEKIRTAMHDVVLQRDDICNEPGESDMDTFGSLVDKLVTVDLKMWHNQEALYEIRRMTKDEFMKRWGNDMLELHKVVKRCCDLNVQRSKLMDEIDVFLEQAVTGKKEGDLVRKQHKTY